eukprot:TRINITY_DN1019_c6_g1_i1.p1 TRINITY_DN1019_c6_g1~~TRINITY_DN1019_c6_g1_i1.p1  ORF type:complete len:985 (+),score=183.65 TRINITY_DN1019_c6_g1_i1:141-2957(+)
MARDKRVTTHMMSGEMINRKKAYSVFARLVGDLVSERGADAYQLGPQQITALKLMCPGLEVDEEGASVDGIQDKMTAVNEVVRQVLSRYCRGHGYLLVIDDTQWMDDLSWSVLMYLAENEPAVSVVMAKRVRGVQNTNTNVMADDENNKEKFHLGLMQSVSRCRLPSLDDELDASIKSVTSGTQSTDGEVDELEELAKGTTYKMEFLSEYRTYGGSCVFQLTPFNRDMSSLFYKMVLSVKSVDPAVFDYAYERSSGNPGVAERLFVALNNRKALVVLGDRVVEFTPAVHPSDFAHVVPPDIKDMFLSVTDKLPHDQQYHLKIMSVLGLSFSLPLVSSVAGIPQDKMRDICDSLTNNAILLQAPLLPGCPDLQYSFRVPLLRDCVYQKILLHQKKDLHLKVVYALEGSGRYDPKVIAEHLVKAEDDRAVAFLGTAAEKEFSGNNYRVAEELIRQLLDCSRKAPMEQNITWTRRLVVCSFHTGKYQVTKSLLSTLQGYLNVNPPAPTKTNLLKASITTTIFASLPCCIPSIPATTTDRQFLAEKLFLTVYMCNVMLFESEVAPIELLCLRALRYLEAYRRCSKGRSRKDDKRLSLGSNVALVAPPEEAWRNEDGDLAGMEKVEPAVRSTLKYIDYCKKGVGGRQEEMRESAYRRGLLQPVWGNSPAAMYCIAAKMDPDVTSSILLLRDIQAAAEKKSDTYTVHLSLALQVVLETVRGQIGDALIVAGELRESSKSEPTRDTRFGLYSLALGCIVLYTHIEAPSSLQEPRERIENVLVYSDSSETEIADPILRALLGVALAVGLSREEDSDAAMSVVRTYQLVHAVTNTELFTPFHFVMLPSLMEVLVRAYIVRVSKDPDPINQCLEKYKEMSSKFPIILPAFIYWKGEVLKAKGDIPGATAAWKEGVSTSVSLKMPYSGALCKAGLAENNKTAAFGHRGR